MGNHAVLQLLHAPAELDELDAEGRVVRLAHIAVTE
jgi:hypothetical protein